MSVENCVENENVANNNFHLLEDKYAELIAALAILGETVTPLQPLSYLHDSTLFTGVDCEPTDPHEEIQEVCVEHLRDLAQRDDHLDCLLVQQAAEISNLSDRIAVLQSSCCYGNEDVFDPIEELMV